MTKCITLVLVLLLLTSASTLVQARQQSNTLSAQLARAYQQGFEHGSASVMTTKTPFVTYLEIAVTDVSNGRTFSIDIPEKSLVVELANLIMEVTGIAVQQQRLRFRGTVLNLAESLRFYRITNLSQISVERFKPKSNGNDWMNPGSRFGAATTASFHDE